MFWGLEYQAKMGTNRIRMQRLCRSTASRTVPQISKWSALAVDLVNFDLTAVTIWIANWQLARLGLPHLLISVYQLMAGFFMSLGRLLVLFSLSVSMEALARAVSSFVAL